MGCCFPDVYGPWLVARHLLLPCNCLWPSPARAVSVCTAWLQEPLEPGTGKPSGQSKGRCAGEGGCSWGFLCPAWASNTPARCWKATTLVGFQRKLSQSSCCMRNKMGAASTALGPEETLHIQCFPPFPPLPIWETWGQRLAYPLGGQHGRQADWDGQGRDRRCQDPT